MILDSHIYSHYDEPNFDVIENICFKLSINDSDVEDIIMFLEISSKSK